MMNERFGCSTVTFGGDLPTKLDAMRKAGFAATEITTRDMFETLRGMDHTAAQIRASGLRLSGYQLLRDFEGCPRDLRQGKLERSRQIFEQARMLDADLVLLAANTSQDCSADIGMICDDLAALGEVAASFGARVAIEGLCWATHLSDYRKVWEAVRRTDHPAVGIMLDSSHIGGIDLPFAPIRDIAGDKIFLVEIADLPKTSLPPMEVSLAYRLFPGEGVLDLVEFIRAIESTGYDGYYSVEVFNAYYKQLDPYATAARALAALQSVSTRATTA